MKSYLTMRERIIRPLFVIVFALMLCLAGFSMAVSDSSAQTSSEFEPELDRLNMSQSWTNDVYFDFTTLKRNNDLGRDTKLVTTQTFGTKYKVKFTLIIDKEAWDGNPPKRLFRFALDADDDTNTDSGKQIDIGEHLIYVGPGLTIAPTAYGGSANLWQQTYRDGSGFGTFPDVNGFYQFMLDVDGNTLDLYIERQIDLPFTEPRYIITSDTGFEGHLAFMSYNTNYDFRIGGVTVEYEDEEGNPALFRGLFNVDGSISGDFNNKDCLWHSNMPDFNTQSVKHYAVGRNNAIVSDFGLNGLQGVIEYELTDIVNNNAWNNVTGGIRFVAGITDDNPQGYALASLYNCFFNVGDDPSSMDLNLDETIQNGLRSHGNTFKIKLVLYDTYYEAYISGYISQEGVRSYSDYYQARIDHPSYLGKIPYTDLGENAAEDIANGRLSVFSKNDMEHEHEVYFAVKALRVQTSDVVFMADGNVVKVITVDHGADITDIPAVPSKVGYDGVWNKTANELKSIKEGFTVTAVYTPKTYTITSPTENNFTFESSDSQTVEYSGSYSFTITPAAAYNKSAITVKANGIALTPASGVYTINNISEDIVITVEGLTLNTYTVTSPTENNFSFESSDEEEVEHGGSYSFTITPDAGYNKSTITVKVNGESLTPVEGVYTIENVTFDVTITVEALTKNIYSVVYKADGVVVKTITVEHGGAVAESDIPAVPAKEGYTGTWKSATLTNITADITIEAEYTEASADKEEGCAGCGSAMAGGSVLFGLLVISAVAMLVFRRRREGTR